jgi:hypothetical protein
MIFQDCNLYTVLITTGLVIRVPLLWTELEDKKVGKDIDTDIEIQK